MEDVFEGVCVCNDWRTTGVGGPGGVRGGDPGGSVKRGCGTEMVVGLRRGAAAVVVLMLGGIVNECCMRESKWLV